MIIIFFSSSGRPLSSLRRFHLGLLSKGFPVFSYHRQTSLCSTGKTLFSPLRLSSIVLVSFALPIFLRFFCLFEWVSLRKRRPRDGKPIDVFPMRPNSDCAPHGRKTAEDYPSSPRRSVDLISLFASSADSTTSNGVTKCLSWGSDSSADHPIVHYVACGSG